MSRLTRIAFSTFEGLRNTDNDALFHALLRASKAESAGEVVVIDSAEIKGEAFKIAWAKWVERNPSLILSKDDTQDELWQAEQAAARLEENKAFVQKHANEAAKRYFEYWVREKGLLDTARGTIFHEMEKRWERDKTPPSAALLDVVIELLNTQGVLQWGKPAEPAPAPVELPPPVILSDGSHQLPLDAVPSSRHTVAQLKDWSERTRAAERVKVREHNNAVAAAFRAANQSTTLEV